MAPLGETPSPGEELGPMVEAFLNLPDGVVMVDGTGTVVWANRSAERIFERRLEDWVGRSGLDLVHPDDQEFVLRSLSTVQDKDVGSPIEIRVNAASGWRLIELVGSTTPWHGDTVVLLSMRDITERRRFELANGHEARFRSLVHNAGSIIMLVSESGRIESVSAVITRILGHDPEVLVGQPLSDIVARTDRSQLKAALAAAGRGATSARPVTARVRLRRHDGAAAVPFELNIVSMLDDPTVDGFVISANDATARVSAEDDLVDALSRLTATLDSTADGILVVDTAGRITEFNHRFVEIWDLPDGRIARQTDVSSLQFAMDQLANPQALVAKEELDPQPESETFDLLEFKDGRVVERFTKPQRVDGEIVGRVYSFRDITDRKILEDELSYRAFHDALTRLANKSLFQDRLKHALSRQSRTGTHLAVLFLDLDDFKTVNDSLGHGEGDQLLRMVATKLLDLLRPADTAARMGGDEFAVLIEDLPSADAATELAQRILDALRPPVRLGTKSVSAACSIGIACDEEGITSEQLLRNADIAMYQAKKKGKDRFEVYRPEMHALVLARIELEEDLKSALAGEELVPYFQPVVDLQTHRVVGFEALVRWPHPEGVLVDPKHFVPLAQEIGLIGEIDSCILRKACRQVRQWQEAGICGLDLEIGVNLSAGQLADDMLAERIAADINECRFDPRSLIFEITESEVITDDAATLRNLAKLRMFGVRIALDDFGTGYSTFLHLDRLPIDIVKIDRSFVETLGSGDDSRSMAAALVQLARTLGYGTIAEGVETGAQQDSLRRLGCERAQGYHLGRPLDADAAHWLLAAQDVPGLAVGQSTRA
ncbi:MAG TPA: EAL domain-containing protein [Acidimicrobiales bacterium]|nr:EAL domain-containing protein [Acidimicrobiales bacterium]